MVMIKIQKKAKTNDQNKIKGNDYGAAEKEGTIWKEHRGSFNSTADVLLVLLLFFLSPYITYFMLTNISH